jgi:ATP:ADP antiporter, AAA family
MTLFRRHFLLMFSLFFLLSVNHSILRSLRNTLVVVDLGKGAHLIPTFELFGALPVAYLITWLLTRLLNRFRMDQVFLITLTLFLGFFFLFAGWIYPAVVQSHQQWALPLSMLFFAMAELWKPAMAIILFWGLLNRYLPLSEAKSLYAPLMLAGSLGSVVAGPIISIGTSTACWEALMPQADRWTASLLLLLGCIGCLGAVAGWLYCRLQKTLERMFPYKDPEQQKLTVTDCIRSSWQNRSLRLLSWMVIADYIAYGLGEVIYLDALKLRYPHPADYCHFMGNLSLWTGLITGLSSLLITPWVLRSYRWVVASLVTPVCLLVTEALFFFFLRGHSWSAGWFGWSESQWLTVAIVCGSLQFCLCRGAKQTLFDASKELAFVSMPAHERTSGKLVIDGLCARLGRGAGSALSLACIRFGGGVMGGALLTGFLAIGITISWISSTCRLGRRIEPAVTLLAKPE